MRAPVHRPCDRRRDPDLRLEYCFAARTKDRPGGRPYFLLLYPDVKDPRRLPALPWGRTPAAVNYFISSGKESQEETYLFFRFPTDPPPSEGPLDRLSGPALRPFRRRQESKYSGMASEVNDYFAGKCVFSRGPQNPCVSGPLPTPAMPGRGPLRPPSLTCPRKNAPEPGARSRMRGQPRIRCPCASTVRPSTVRGSLA